MGKFDVPKISEDDPELKELLDRLEKRAREGGPHDRNRIRGNGSKWMDESHPDKHRKEEDD